MAGSPRFAASLAARPVPPAPAPAGPPSYTWYGADFKTGVIVEELPFIPSGPVSAILGEYTTIQGTLILPDAPPEWERATDPGRTMLVCVRDSDEMPLQAYIVLGRSGGTGDTVSLSGVSLEGYLDRRFVKDRVESQRNGSQIALDLAWDAMSGADGAGMSVSDFTGADSGTLHDRTYFASSDQTALSQLQELMSVANGPEWTMFVTWKDAAKTTFRKNFRTQKRMGVESDNPSAVFDLPGSIREYVLSEDYTSGKGANWIQTFGDGEGASRPASAVARDQGLLDAGWPRYEWRSTFSGITVTGTLNSHAWEALRYKAEGSRFLTLTADAATGPILLSDWGIGDDVGVQINESPRHPDGLYTIRRAIGWELDTLGGTITPLLAEDRPSYEQVL